MMLDAEKGTSHLFGDSGAGVVWMKVADEGGRLDVQESFQVLHHAAECGARLRGVEVTDVLAEEYVSTAGQGDGVF